MTSQANNMFGTSTGADIIWAVLNMIGASRNAYKGFLDRSWIDLCRVCYGR